VLSSGTAVPDLFLQAALMVPKAQLGNNPFPKLNQFRLYINPTGDGIPLGGNVTITLPFYTQLVPTAQVKPKCPTNPATPNCPDQYIDWWGGGRIEFFRHLNAAHQPPAALTADYMGTNLPARGCQVKCNGSLVPSACVTTYAKFACNPIAGAAVPTCPTCQQPLQIFKDPAGLKNNEPSQLTEYTLGAINQNKDPFGLDVHNVDYDVSYVDTAFMPIAMEPVNNIQVGYIGMITSIETFRAALTKFTMPSSPWTGWPQFKDDQGVTILKIPSALHIFAGDPDMTPPGPPLAGAAAAAIPMGTHRQNGNTLENMRERKWNCTNLSFNARCKGPVRGQLSKLRGDLRGSVVWLQLRQDASQTRGADRGVDAAVGTWLESI
jgi:hypothetical protein